METSYPQGHKHFYFIVFNCIFSKTVTIHWGDKERLFRSINGATYTMDGRLFVGWHTPDSYEDFDEFSVGPPDILCCCCWYNSETYSNECNTGLNYITEQGNINLISKQ